MENNILMEILKDRIDEMVNKAVANCEQQVTVTCLRSIMSKLQYTAVQAMDLLNIPQSQRSTYARLVENGTM